MLTRAQHWNLLHTLESSQWASALCSVLPLSVMYGHNLLPTFSLSCLESEFCQLDKCEAHLVR